MRTILLAFASVAALSAAASAEPLSVTSTQEQPATPATYVEAGLAGGFNDHALLGGAKLEVGRRVSSFASIHGTVMSGLTSRVLDEGSGSITQARVGADLFTCNSPDSLCAFVGADIGIQHAQYTSYDCGLFEGPCDHSDPMTERDKSAIGVARVGIDAGGQHFRWRLGLETTVVGGHLNGMDAINAIAYRF